MSAISIDRNPGASAGPLARFSWALFDWANQPYFTVITTFIFAPYFTSQFIGDPVRGQSLWGYTQSIAGITIALLSPMLGAVADAGGPRKPFILVFQAFMVIGCGLLWFALPGHLALLPLIMAALVLAAIGAEFSIVFNNAMLPTLVPRERLGRLSGFAWGLGYLGGLLPLFAILIVSRPELVGVTPPAGQALFGLDRATGAAERLTGPFSALWLIVFVLPMFLFTPDVPRTGLGPAAAVRAGLARLLTTIASFRRNANWFRFLIAFMIYNDGILALIAFGGIYAAGQFGWGTTELGIFGIILSALGIFGAWIGGALDDRFGSRSTILLTTAGMAVAAAGVFSVTRTSALFVIDLPPPTAGAGLFASTQERIFLGFAILMGLCLGPIQAASRTMVGRLAPPGKIAEFYGLFSLSGRATAFLAPFAIAVVTQAFDSQRAGMSVVLVFLVVGLLLMLRVEEPAR